MRVSRYLVYLIFLAIASCATLPAPVEGELRIRNRTNSDVWISIADSEPKQLESLANWSRYYDQNAEVEVSYNGNHAFPNTQTLIVRPNLVSTLDISPDGGAIKLVNTGETSIQGVYLSNSDDSSWGINDLGGSIDPGSDMIWTVTAGLWDLRIEDEDLLAHFAYDQLVSTDQTLVLSIGSFVLYESKAKTMLSPAVKPTEEVEDRY